MDVYADGLIHGLKTVRPDWEIVELVPNYSSNNTLIHGLAKYYQRYWHYPQTVHKYPADIFHIIDHSDGHIAYWLKKNGKPVAVTCHDLINFLQPENISDQARLPFISSAIWKFAVKSIRQADHIISVSEYTAKDITQILKIQPKNLTVVPNAVEPIFQPLRKEQTESIRQKHQISADTICLLNVGSNHPRKNIFTILKALKILKNQGISINFLKTGADFTTEQKTYIQTHKLEVTYLGKPDKSTLVQIYNIADILISPSLYEGFGMTILEAMGCGTPVITSNVTSLPEVAGDAAITLNPTDEQAIAQAVCNIHHNPTYRQSLIQKGLHRVKSFTWEKTAEQIAQVYEKILH
jgi:glycosyltransferase involved in cell wall biosynthesis